MAKSSHRIRIHAAPDQVFKALSTKDGLQGWFTAKVDGNVGEGHDVRMHFEGKESFGWHFAQVTSDRVRWNCTEGPGSARGTTATYLLKAEGRDTILECDHDGWPEGHEALATCNTLWGTLMDRLKAFAETGKPKPAFS